MSEPTQSSSADRPRTPAEELFARHLSGLEADELADVASLCAAHPEQAEELRRIHRHWEELTGVIHALDAGQSFYERLRRRYGKDADPGLSLDEPPKRGAAPKPDSAPTRTLARLEARAPREARYERVAEIARGGMGAILKVWDGDLRRTLAMKVMLDKKAPAGDQPSAGVTPKDERLLARFLEEAQITAQLDHPGIVPVHELGLDSEGRVYFTMPLVKGQDLAEILELAAEEQEGWTKTRVLGVILKICEAMAYAHSKKVVHRDLKPANVMAGRFGEVYVMDWGLARVIGRRDRRDLRIREAPDRPLTIVHTDRREANASGGDSPLMTMDGDIVGTPSYMSPEQARGDLEAVGPASDVYSLGCILYHLFAGHMPYVPKDSTVNAYAVWGMLQNGPPRPVQEIAPDTPEELVAVCAKAMARDVEDRYRDTVEMADDLRAYLEGRVVKAHATGPLIEFKKWVQRNKTLAGTEAAALVLAFGGIGYLTWFQARANRTLGTKNQELAAVNKELLDSEAALFVQETDNELLKINLNRKIERAERAETAANEEKDRAIELTAELEDQRRELNWAEDEVADALADARQQSYVANVTAAAVNLEVDNFPEFLRRLEDCPPELRGWEWHHLRLFESASLTSFEPDPASARRALFTPDGARVVRVRGDGGVDVLDSTSGVLLHQLHGHDEPPRAVAIHPDGRLAATGSPDRTIRLWDLEQGSLVATLPAGENEVRALEFSADGSTLFAGDGWAPEVQLNGVVTFTVPERCPIRVWDVERRTLMRTIEGHEAPIRDLVLHPDGRRLLSASQDKTLVLWDITSGERLATYRGHVQAVTSAAFTSDGERLVSGSLDWSVMLWDVENAEQLHTFRGHGAPVHGVAVSPDDRRAASTGEDSRVRLWDLSTTAEIVALRGRQGSVGSVAFSPDGERLLTASLDDGVRLWDSYAASPVSVLREGDHRLRRLPLAYTDARGGEPEPVWLLEVEGEAPMPIGGAARLSETGDLIVHRGRRRKLRGEYTVDLWDARTHELRHTLVGHGDSITAVAVSPDGTRVATAAQDRTVRLWDASSGAPLAIHDVRGAPVACLAFAPAGDQLASGARDGRVVVRHLSSGRVVESRGRHSGGVTALAWDPTGAFVASGGSDDEIRIWSALDGFEAQRLLGHNGDVTCLAFAPDGTRLFSGSRDSTIRLWDPDTGHALLRLADPGQTVETIRFGSRGRLMAGGVDRRPMAGVWDGDIEQARETWRARETERAARVLVDRLCAECETTEEVLRAIETEAGLDPDLRARAARLATRLDR